jgi:predicted phage tail protein
LSGLRVLTVVFVLLAMGVFMIVAGLMQMLVRIMEMDVAFPPHLPDKVVEAEE